jgi:hypothetical protein
MSERFALLDIEGDISGKLRLIYGSEPADPDPARCGASFGENASGLVPRNREIRRRKRR